MDSHGVGHDDGAIRGQEVFVACADVLGFKNLIQTRELVDIVPAFTAFLGSEGVAGHLDWALGAAFLPGQPRQQLAQNAVPIRHAVFSDTVLLWSSDASASSLREILKACITVIAAGLSNSMVPLPFRIGLALGEVQIEPKMGLYIGRGIVDAYTTEREQDWIGGALHPSISEDLIARLGPKETASPLLLVNYSAPIHGNPAATRASQVLNWPFWLGTRQYVLDLLERLRTQAGAAHFRKYDETIRFYEERQAILNGSGVR